LPVYIHTHTNVGGFILIFNNMALIFLGVLIVFTISSFEFHQVKLSWFHRQRWVAPNSPNLNPLDYQVWRQCWSLITGSNQSEEQFLGL